MTLLAHKRAILALGETFERYNLRSITQELLKKGTLLYGPVNRQEHGTTTERSARNVQGVEEFTAAASILRTTSKGVHVSGQHPYCGRVHWRTISRFDSDFLQVARSDACLCM